MKYLCQEECFFKKRLWTPGEEYTGSEDPPVHFVPVEDFVPEVPTGNDLSEPMTLSEAEKKVMGKRKKNGDGDPVNLAERDAMFQ
jgi:hypothetical protein